MAVTFIRVYRFTKHDHTDGIVGFYGASSIERFPAETSIKKQTEDFKALKFNKSCLALRA